MCKRRTDGRRRKKKRKTCPPPLLALFSFPAAVFEGSRRGGRLNKVAVRREGY